MSRTTTILVWVLAFFVYFAANINPHTAQAANHDSFSADAALRVVADIIGAGNDAYAQNRATQRRRLSQYGPRGGRRLFERRGGNRRFRDGRRNGRFRDRARRENFRHGQPRRRNPYRSLRPEGPGKFISPSRAIGVARGRINGKILGIRRAQRYGKMVYVIKLRAAAQVHEVTIDATSGRVLN